MSNSPRVAVLDTGYESFAYEEQLLTRNGYQFDVWTGESSDVEGKLRFASGTNGLFIRWTEIDERVLERLPGLKAIVRYGVGFENIDVDAATRAGVKVCNVQNYGNHAVSDHALAMMYACARGLVRGEKSILEKFGAPPFRPIFEFHDKTIGIVGLGRIGGTLCGKVRHLFRRVLATDPFIDPSRFTDLGANEATFDELCAESDVISIHCNHTEATEGLFNEKAFSKMKRRPVLINTARGPIVDDAAIIAALDRDQIHSAGIDVYDTELAEELPNELLVHPRAITTGHYAWYSERSHVELQRRAADNLLAMLRAETPDDCLNPEVGVVGE